MTGKPDPFSHAEQTRRGHAIEWNEGWSYTNTWVWARDYPDGWPQREVPPGPRWEPNDQRGDGGYAVEDTGHGVMWVSYWRREKRRSGK